MALLKFRKGEYKNLASTPFSEGTVYITTDEKAMYVDVDGGTRIRIGQIITLASKDLTPPYSTESFYYLTDLNALVRWNGTAWVQLNGTGDLRAELDSLKITVGGTDGKGGLVGTVSGHTTEINTIKTTLNGDDTNQGLIKDVDDLAKKVNDLEVIGGQANIIEKIKITGATEDLTPDAQKRITLGKLAGVGAKVAVADLDADTIARIEAVETLAGNAATSAELTEAKNKLQGDINTVSGEVTKVKNTIGLRFTGTEAKETVEDAIEALEGTVGGHTTTIGAHDTKIKALDTLTQQHTTAIAENKTLAQKGVDDAKTAQNAADAAAAAASTADGKAVAAHNAANAAQGTADTAKTLAEGNQTAIGLLDTRVGTLESEKVNYATKTELGEQKTALEAKIKIAQDAADAAQGSADANAGEIATIKGDISTINTNIGVINENLDKKVNNEAYNAKVTELQNAITAAQNAADAAQGSANTNAAAIENNTKAIEANATAITTLEGKIGNLSNVMNFRGAFETYDKLTEIENPQLGDVAVVTSTGSEYVYSDGTWVEFGYSTTTSTAIADLDSRLTTAEGNITTLTGIVGDQTKGLVKDVASHAVTIEQNASNIAALMSYLTWGDFTAPATGE